MDNLRVVNLLNELEKKLPVIDWKADGIQIWPLIRLKLGFEICFPPKTAILVKEKEELRKIKKQSFGVNISLQQFKTKLIAYCRLRQEYSRFRCKKGVFVLGYSSNRAATNSIYYDRVHDPLTTWSKQNGYSPIVVEFTNGVPYSSHPIHEEHLIKGDQLLWDWQQNTATRIRDLHLPGYTEFCEKLKEYGLSSTLSVIDIEALSSFIGRFLSAVRFFGKLLDKGSYKLCLLSTYYDWRGMALTVAANARGITTVDLQHGSRNAGHFAYASWSVVPGKGWECLPRWFWCWNTFAAVPILTWNAPHRQFHDVIFGGNPWITIWKQKDFPWTANQDDKVKEISGKKNALYTLQPYAEITIPGIRELVTHLAGEWHWWIRVHPRQSREHREQLKVILSELHPAVFFVDEVADIPLPLLLLHTHLHITMWSSVIEEASEYGVPTVFVHENGKKLFSQYIDSGIAADGTSNLLQVVDAILSKPNHQSIQQGDLKTAMHKLLQLT